MSDNSINYDELDKAVNAAMSARATAKAKPAAAPKPAEPKKPASRGMFMDFAPRRSQVIARVTTTTRTVSVKPAARPVATRPVAPARPAAPVRRPAAVKPVAPRAAANPAARAAHLAAHPTAKPAARPVSARAVAPAVRPATPVKPAAKPAAKLAQAPNANNYSLGGRSPFLNPNAQVEKRPLGANVPETNASNLKSTHNVYSHKSPLRDKTNTGKHVVAESPKKKSGWLWTLTVIGVIAAGAGLGYLAYLLILANK